MQDIDGEGGFHRCHKYDVFKELRWEEYKLEIKV